MSDVEAGDDVPIEPVDWDGLDTDRRILTPRIAGFAVAMLVLGAVYWYYDYSRSTDIFYLWSPTKLTWLFRVSFVALVFLVIPPLVRNRRHLHRLRDRLASDWVALASFVYFGLFVVVGLLGPAVVGRPRVNINARFQPPVGFTAPEGRLVQNCIGPVVGPEATQSCVGTLQYPLGTGRLGENMFTLLVSGMHVSLQVAVIASVLIIPIATAVGVVSGYVGGRVDTVLMRYVDIQQAIPAIVAYIILVFVFGPSLFLLVVVFGLFNWGNVARLVRSEVLQRREEPYIEAARASGVSEAAILRRHVLPNVSNTVLVGTTQKIPQLVLLETGLTFVELGDIGRWFQSFGEIMRNGLHSYGGRGMIDVWWIWLIPAVVLAVTVVSISIVGDTLRDVLDPRGEP